jgi:carboxyl-terminal processing protease
MRKFAAVVLLVGLSSYIGFLLGKQQLVFAFYNYKPSLVLNKTPEITKEVDFSLFWTVWDRLSDEYVDKKALDPKKMVDGAISGMVSSLGDPYTVYLPVSQNKDAKADLAGEFGGVGIQLGYKNNVLAVVAPVPDTPAERAGVKAGDLILHIKDTEKKIDLDTDKMPIVTAVGYIRGKKGTTVSLTLVREEEKVPLVVDLVRDTIIDKSVTLKIIDNNIAHLRLSKFGDRTPAEWQEAIAKVGNLPIVLDLRNNPGGYLEGSVYVASEFLSQGKIVVTQQAGDGSKIEHKVMRKGSLLKNKLVVLVNEGSASAAEILAGAVKDHNRAKIVGVKTFGKGSVQSPEDFPDGSGVHITVAKWLRPNRDWIDKKGIEPDVKIEAEKIDESKPRDTAAEEQNDLQLKKAIELL